MAFNLFPYTNFHKLNLDWILTKVKEALTASQHAEQSAAAAEQAVATAQAAAETAQQAAEAAQEAAEAAQADVDTLDANAVQYVPQERSEDLQAQARTNISAASVAYVDQQAHVPEIQTGDAGKVLTAGGSGYAWETPIAISGTADVLVVTITESGGAYSADKTYAQVAQAFTAGWPVLFRLGNQLAPDLSLTAEGWQAVGLDDEYNRLIITLASDNTVTVSTAALPTPVVSLVLESTNLETSSGSVQGNAEEIRQAFMAGVAVSMISTETESHTANVITKVAVWDRGFQDTLSNGVHTWQAYLTWKQWKYILHSDLTWTGTMS